MAAVEPAEGQEALAVQAECKAPKELAELAAQAVAEARRFKAQAAAAEEAVALLTQADLGQVKEAVELPRKAQEHSMVLAATRVQLARKQHRVSRNSARRLQAKAREDTRGRPQ